MADWYEDIYCDCFYRQNDGNDNEICTFDENYSAWVCCSENGCPKLNKRDSVGGKQYE